MQAKPKLLELEELYQGIPDESVNLTFQDLANVNTSNKINTTVAIIEPISDASIISNPTKLPSSSVPSLTKLPSLDFQKGLQASNNHSHHHHLDFGHGGDSPLGQFSHRVEHDRGHDRFNHVSEYSMGYDAMNSGMSLASGKGGAAGRRKRPGIPHSKICTICSNYVYFLRTRCLVCGRVYCRRCVEIGMGEMIEGRKCIECLGLRFSQRYIERAGVIGCCSWRYPSTLKDTELKWAEKGPRKNSDRGYGHHGIASSRPRTPTSPRSPLAIVGNEPSFVMSASYTFSPHHLPL
ncbi:uncharacterized protein LOC133292102 [Gastrolobium bilobum]|uniref:uncharacterized protein LOC133292102 n=1 Tax=Gastrolobium bilobum TaxID=150636 RepID=UPI002AB2A7D2|nr:uncharacterized protein LOC133292102 [Gastrolobium bilobum]